MGKISKKKGNKQNSNKIRGEKNGIWKTNNSFYGIPNLHATVYQKKKLNLI